MIDFTDNFTSQFTAQQKNMNRPEGSLQEAFFGAFFFIMHSLYIFSPYVFMLVHAKNWQIYFKNGLNFFHENVAILNLWATLIQFLVFSSKAMEERYEHRTHTHVQEMVRIFLSFCMWQDDRMTLMLM